MNKFKVGDIVLAIADNEEFVGDKRGDLFKIKELVSGNITNRTVGLNSVTGEECCYYAYKFRKATKKEITKFNFDWMVNKLKGELVDE